MRANRLMMRIEYCYRDPHVFNAATVAPMFAAQCLHRFNEASVIQNIGSLRLGTKTPKNTLGGSKCLRGFKLKRHFVLPLFWDEHAHSCRLTALSDRALRR